MRDLYYVFCKNHLKAASFKNFDVFDINEVVLTNSQSKRLFGSECLANESVELYRIRPRSDSIISTFENGRFFSDSNEQVYNLLLENEGIYGYSSVHMNKMLNSIIQIKKNCSFCLMGDRGWNSLKELFSVLNNSGVQYVVLRKYESLPFGFIDGDHDVDVLCNSLAEMLLISGAQKRNVGISSFCLKVGESIVDFDIRFVGDCYLDSLWSRELLLGIVLNNNRIPVMQPIDQLFTILYHCLTQKNHVSRYYRNKIKELSNIVFGFSFPTAPSELCKLLALFMHSKHYCYVKPMDIAVFQNKRNIHCLNKYLRNNPKQIELMRSIYMRIPSKFRNKYLKEKAIQFFEQKL